MAGSEKFPHNYRELVSRHLVENYGDKISIRSAIVRPPTQEKTMKGDEEVATFKGSVSFNVVDRKVKDFGKHELTYLIRDQEVTFQEEE